MSVGADLVFQVRLHDIKKATLNSKKCLMIYIDVVNVMIWSWNVHWTRSDFLEFHLQSFNISWILTQKNSALDAKNGSEHKFDQCEFYVSCLMKNSEFHTPCHNGNSGLDTPCCRNMTSDWVFISGCGIKMSFATGVLDLFLIWRWVLLQECDIRLSLNIGMWYWNGFCYKSHAPCPNRNSELRTHCPIVNSKLLIRSKWVFIQDCDIGLDLDIGIWY